MKLYVPHAPWTCTSIICSPYVCVLARVVSALADAVIRGSACAWSYRTVVPTTVRLYRGKRLNRVCFLSLPFSLLKRRTRRAQTAKEQREPEGFKRFAEQLYISN